MIVKEESSTEEWNETKEEHCPGGFHSLSNEKCVNEEKYKEVLNNFSYFRLSKNDILKKRVKQLSSLCSIHVFLASSTNSSTKCVSR